MTLEKLKKECEGCQKCSLHKSRTNIVFGRGSEHPRVMVIGEAPGKNEDLSGEPFVGAAGKKLDKLFVFAGLLPEDYYIGNILKCRPPNNRDPLEDEKKLCTPYLDKQIGILKPDIILTLGNHATKYMFGQSNINYPGITKVRGKIAFGKDGRQFFPTFHPAAAIYDKNKQVILEQDFKNLGKILRDMKNG